MKHFISIVVPCYNASAFFEPLFVCLKNQSCNDFELVMVNDGSTDNSEAEFERWSKDLNFKTQWINQKNGGPGKARKTGIENASGDYIFFLDADDFLVTECVQFWYDEISKDNFDILIANSKTISENGEILGISSFKREFKIPYLDFLYQNFPFTLWPSLYRTSLFENIDFYEDFRTGEDFLILCQLFLIENLKIKLAEKIIHQYIRNKGSITSSMNDEKYLQNYLAYKNGIAFFDRLVCPDNSELQNAIIFNRVIFIYGSVSNNSPYCKDLIEELENRYDKGKVRNILKGLPLKNKIVLKLTLNGDWGLSLSKMIVKLSKKINYES